MRSINLIVIHCSASDNPKHDNVETIRNWHTYDRGFNDIGYHYVITKDGEIHNGRPINKAGAHAKGYNKKSIGICLTGLNEFTRFQKESCKKLLMDLLHHFELRIIDIIPHNQLNKNKTCPNFDIYKEILCKDF